MSNFLQKDVFVPLAPNDDFYEAVLSFAWYLVNERPLIKEGNTFSSGQQTPIFKILGTEQDELNPDKNDVFHNVYGLWKLYPLHTKSRHPS